MLVLVCVLVLAAPGLAITGGAYDGNAHPYVGILRVGGLTCSGTLLSPTVLLTSAHCAAGIPPDFGTNSLTGAPIARVSFDPNVASTPPDQRVFYYGSFYGDPAYNPNLPNSKDPDSHDVGIIVFGTAGCALCAGPVPASATQGKYGALPSAGLVDTLPMNTPVEIAGFGVQDLVHGGGQKPQPDPATAGIRMSAPSELIASNAQTSSRFIRLHQNQGGVCFGDSGGPDLLGATTTVLAVNSYVSNDVCSGLAYSYRVDTPSALGWITATAASRGGSL
jgi:hypothetical protein